MICWFTFVFYTATLFCLHRISVCAYPGWWNWRGRASLSHWAVWRWGLAARQRRSVRRPLEGWGGPWACTPAGESTGRWPPEACAAGTPEQQLDTNTNVSGLSFNCCQTKGEIPILLTHTHKHTHMKLAWAKAILWDLLYSVQCHMFCMSMNERLWLLQQWTAALPGRSCTKQPQQGAQEANSRMCCCLLILLSNARTAGGTAERKPGRESVPSLFPTCFILTTTLNMHQDERMKWRTNVTVWYWQVNLSFNNWWIRLSKVRTDWVGWTWCCNWDNTGSTNSATPKKHV